MAALGAEIFSLGFRFNPKPIEAISYYLPRLIAGVPLHEAVRPVVHHADVYACDPGELTRRFRPLPVTGHRFFFTSCKKGTRVAGPGSWALQSSKDIKDADGNKVGEIKKLRYKKRGVFTDWLMDESSTCGIQDALVGGDRQLVFCKIYVSPKADSDSPAHQESAAFFAPSPVPVVMAQAAPPPPKRPVALVGAEPPCPKRIRRAPVAPSHPVTTAVRASSAGDTIIAARFGSASGASSDDTSCYASACATAAAWVSYPYAAEDAADDDSTGGANASGVRAEESEDA